MSNNTFSRRAMLGASALLSGACALFANCPSVLAALKIPFFPTRTVEKDTFRFDPETGSFLEKDKMVPFTLKVDGLVENPLSLRYGQLRDLPQKEQVSDFHCVEGWSVHDAPWGGFEPGELARLAKPRKEAKWVVLHSHGSTSFPPAGQTSYIESFPLKDLLNPELAYLLALDLGGKPLIHDRGAPLRLVTPYDLSYKSIKYIERIEFASKPRKGWWTLANPIYPIFAPVPANRLRDKMPKREKYFL